MEREKGQSSDCQWSEGVVSNGVITSSTAYMSDVLNQAFALEGPAGIANSYDFMNLLTAYEVVDSTGVTGCGAIFQRDLMCRVVAAARVSVTMIRDGGVGFNTAHFFAMHVGAENDENSAACTSADQFASAFKWERASMSTANAVNPWRWSTCALDQIQQTIEEDSSYVACLTDQNFSTEDYDAYHAQGALGKTLSAEDQCRYAFGDGSTFCGTQDETVCYLGLDCTNPDTNACDEVIYALEGSICNQEGNANAANNHNTNTDNHNTNTDYHNTNTDNHNTYTDNHNTYTDNHNTNTDNHNTNTYYHNTNTDNHNTNTDYHNTNTNNHNTNTDNYNHNTITYHNHNTNTYYHNHNTNTDNHNTNTNNHNTNTDYNNTNTNTHNPNTDNHNTNTDYHNTNTDNHNTNTDNYNHNTITYHNNNTNT
ncbi:hypothetical protein KP79_PYT23385 [Mizuhopecten yessoensis]|uniref:Uncharacterized protein n=1 Tax=Mizuhopecten yessoensis TaxID=6573 RepID=A0A210QVX3_MIZYE|nr:hypothetical protein KP79_PYT23385 [Mizuhopecten yessoensis]